MATSLPPLHAMPTDHAKTPTFSTLTPKIAHFPENFVNI